MQSIQNHCHSVLSIFYNTSNPIFRQISFYDHKIANAITVRAIYLNVIDQYQTRRFLF